MRERALHLVNSLLGIGDADSVTRRIRAALQGPRGHHAIRRSPGMIGEFLDSLSRSTTEQTIRALAQRKHVR